MARIPADPIERETLFNGTVGTMMRTWALCEISLMLLLTQLIDNNQFKARIIFLTMPNLRVKLNLISRLGETYIDDSILPEFRALMRRTRNIGNNRNLLAHSVGGLTPNGNFAYISDEDDDENGVNFTGGGEMPLQNILDWPSHAAKLNEDISDFAHQTLRGKLHASARMHRKPPVDHTPITPPALRRGVLPA